jgi:hypothetical protein
LKRRKEKQDKVKERRFWKVQDAQKVPMKESSGKLKNIERN